MTRNSIELVVLVIFALALLFQVQRIHVLKADSLALQAQLSALEQESQMQAKRFENARKQAEDAIKDSRKRADEILIAKVPKDCAGAIKWGVQQAHAFS